ncbi:MAG: carboxypeptidase regulatory-like domain-containing protein [Candidatus Hydrogenedentes bacterium]|nr:carboxypeptidase regulatory-like domain-containing protein [Candidatus Hydrogenedentota bacterium]
MIFLAFIVQAAALAGPPTFYVVEARLPDRATLDRLVAEEYIIDDVQGLTAVLYVTEEQRHALEAAGIPLRLLETQVPGAAKALGGYHDYAQLTAELQAYAAAHPTLCRLSTLGQSVQGRELWALMISDNPEVQEDEPEVKYVSTMHGDEPVGTELCLYLIDRLLVEYGVDNRITALVDNTEIWFVPLMNPDGLQLGTRANAHGRDLNRSFPEYPEDFTATLYDGEPMAVLGREPEVLRIMLWSAARSFTLAANFHTGALVVNYPYDDDGLPSGSYAASPDDALFQVLSLEYASQNPPMFSSPFFSNGIVNGTAWYVVRGGMQDWDYRYLGCPEVTIELSNTKKPSVSTLPSLWANNEESMLRYLEAAQRGVRGVVTDRVDRTPVYAKLSVAGNTQPVFTDFDVGDYHRLLLPGTYAITVEADGFLAQTKEDVVVSLGPAARVDFRLLPEGDSDWDGHSNAFEGFDDVDQDGRENFLDGDSDNDHVADFYEAETDADNDGLPNIFDPDSDNDGYDDRHEELTGSDPNDPHSIPGAPMPAAGIPFLVGGALALLGCAACRCGAGRP